MLKRCFILCLMALLLLPTTLWAKEQVIVLHGLARSSDSMSKMAAALEKDGYEVHNISYPSTDQDIQSLTKYLHEKTDKLWKNPKDKVHFVGYSMGCILTRTFINKYKPKNLGRVVMLAPPNHGSEVADFWKNNPLFKKFYGPAGQELTTSLSSVPNKLPKATYPLGIIAGTSTIDPLSSVIIPGEDDGKVSLKSTYLEGMKDHITVEASHTFIMDNDEAIRQTAYFLKNGKFQHAKSTKD